MSNQSGIIVKCSGTVASLRTGRWSASDALHAVFRAVRASAQSERSHWMVDKIVKSLLEDPTIEGFPLTNTDLPTVVVDCRERVVHLEDANGDTMHCSALSFDATDEQILYVYETLFNPDDP